MKRMAAGRICPFDIRRNGSGVLIVAKRLGATWGTRNAPKVKATLEKKQIGAVLFKHYGPPMWEQTPNRGTHEDWS